MYVMGQGHEHLGPGTSMVQRINWSREQENQLRRATRGGLGVVPEFLPDYQLLTMYRGMGCASCSSCSTCQKGMGLFDSGLDVSGWGLPEIGIAGVAALYVLGSLWGDTKRAGRGVATGYRRVKGAGRALRGGSSSDYSPKGRRRN